MKMSGGHFPEKLPKRQRRVSGGSIMTFMTRLLKQRTPNMRPAAFPAQGQP
jgi:hypothetical protein